MALNTVFCYAECHLCWVSTMVSVANKLFMLIVIMLSVIMLIVIMLSVIMLSVIMLSVIMLNTIMLSVIMLSVIMLSVVMLSVVMLSVIMLSVVMLSIVMLSVVAPFKLLKDGLNIFLGSVHLTKSHGGEPHLLFFSSLIFLSSLSAELSSLDLAFFSFSS